MPWTSVKVFITVLGIFLFLLLGITFIKKGVFSSDGGFLASLSSSFSSFISNEEPIAEIDVSGVSDNAFKNCEYDSNLSPLRNKAIINEIAWMGGKEDYNAEWIELKNISGGELNISGWRLISGDAKISIFVPSNTVIPKGGYFLLSRKGDGDLIYEGALINGGMALRLFTESCELADEIPSGKWLAGNNDTKQTMERALDFSWRDSARSGGTPRTENSIGVSIENKKKDESAIKTKLVNEESEVVVTYSPLVLNEVFVGDESSSMNEYIEIWNPSTNPVSLTGWVLKKKSGTGSLSSLVSSERLEGKIIPAGGYFLMANEGGSFASISDVSWARSNILAYSKNSVLLFNPKGVASGEISWSEIPKGSAFSRLENGDFLISAKTPKSEN